MICKERTTIQSIIGTEVNMHQFKCLLNTVVDPGEGPKPKPSLFFNQNDGPRKKKLLL